jgi:hypothetical protein
MNGVDKSIKFVVQSHDLTMEMEAYRKAITLESQHKAYKTRYNPRERLGFWPRKSPQPFGFAKGKKEKEWKRPSGSKGFSRS